ncbi:acetoacetate--CoA ligase [Roseospirillum parvum]|uniref:Acetoacetyl-CoA synthetase n=1 Tax=Roseospirillum parvum TaxID=83401 RepID=A0A1G7TSH0_9PROT|nr:acetoacetate--CoA ligase [Roseospirillum parvum]SDG37510.1 acetoacetyl-CoA synthetase [Roseospirillum parvum]
MEPTSHRLLWEPSPDRVRGANLSAFINLLNRRHGLSLGGYDDLWQWSVGAIPEFWKAVWDFCGVIGRPGEKVVDDPDRLPGAKWFVGGALNYAENLLRPREADCPAIVFKAEDKVTRRLSYSELCALVSRFQQALARLGVAKGDRVAAYLPNMPETVISMLAASAGGAIFSSASPDFGVQGVLDRFGQIEPKVLVAVDGYFYNGKAHDCLEKVAQVAANLPSVEKVVVVALTRPMGEVRDALADIPKAELWDDLIADFPPAEVKFTRVAAEHPLFIMYSSGTTGVPKCIVHGHGGTLLQHLKEHQLQADIKPDDKVFYFTTCGWMMWNWLVTGLASRATLLLYDGAPTAPDGNVLFDYADAEGMTFFGTSAKWIDAIKKMGLRPRDTHSLASVHTIASTGSPLVPESFDYVYEAIKPDVQLASISGGTDILSCFMGANAIGPVYRGEIQARGLGMAVDVFDDEGRPVRDDKGELVCTRAFPSVPVGFWNDPDGVKFHAAYFDRFPGVWTHGDWVSLSSTTGGMTVFGRSDATLNPGGVRIGTAEIYRQVEKLDEVMEGIVVGQDWDNDTRVVLFVRLKDGVELDEALAKRIKDQIRANCTPRHVPAVILSVSDIPRTKSGKIVELAVREVIHGRPVKNKEALANPEALDDYANRPELGT